MTPNELVDITENMQCCEVDRTQFLQGSVDLDDLEDKDSYEFSFHEVRLALKLLRQQQAEIEALKKQLEASALLNQKEWNDRDDQWTAEIDAAHPLKTHDHKTYEMALEMVGNRHGKFALVDLVNWLLRKVQEK